MDMAGGMKASPLNRVRILIADDQKDFALFVERLLGVLKHEVVEVVTSGGLAVIQAYERHKPDLVLMDFHMPQFNGMTACRHIRSKHGSAKIVVMSGDIDLEKAAAKAGAVAAIRKPFTGSELGKLIASFETVDQSAARNRAGEMAHREDPSGPPTQGEIAHV